MNSGSIDGKKVTLGGWIAQHVIVFVICIVFPGIVTGMAPASWICFERIDGEVRCTAKTCMYFVVPFKTQKIQPAREITKRERAGGTQRKREFGRTTNKTVSVDGEGFLQVHGPGDQFIEVSVSPASLDSVVEKARAFVSSSEPESQTLFAIANWKFGALMGGCLTMLTVLYVVGYSLALFLGIFKGLRRLLSIGVSPDTLEGE